MSEFKVGDRVRDNRYGDEGVIDFLATNGDPMVLYTNGDYSNACVRIPQQFLEHID
ncbi:hypothetical protein SEA_CHEESETOUCH_47 [Gordonia phage CheeseTouch]